MTARRQLLEAIDGAVFRTITSDDWRRQLCAARQARNVAQDQIRKKILDLKLGKSTPAEAGKKP